MEVPTKGTGVDGFGLIWVHTQDRYGNGCFQSSWFVDCQQCHDVEVSPALDVVLTVTNNPLSHSAPEICRMIVCVNLS